MKVYDKPIGRLGNAIFRYLASSLFCILYDAERTYNSNECDSTITDQIFCWWMDTLLNDKECQVPSILNYNYTFQGYFQHDNIYKKYKNELIAWIQNHPNDLLKPDDHPNDLLRPDEHVSLFKASDIFSTSSKHYDIVVHIRLDDFLSIGWVIHPLSLKRVLDRLNSTSFCFVCGTLSKPIEYRYIDYFKKFYNITIESNDVLEDYGIMKNAKTLVCSMSTLSWCASFFSNNDQIVYFPDYCIYRIHETFKNPKENTIHYPFIKIYSDDLDRFLDLCDN